jgi:hypothetical protein
MAEPTQTAQTHSKTPFFEQCCLFWTRTPREKHCQISPCTKTIWFILTFWQRSFTFNSNKSPTWCNNFSVTCFGHFPAHHQELSDRTDSLWFYLRIVVTVVLCSWSGRPDHEQQHSSHHDTKVKPEAATAIIELLMMGGKMPETCWAVNKRQDNKLKNCCISLVIYLNCTMMHGLTNLKFYI